LGNLQETGSFKVSLSRFFLRWEEEGAAFEERRGGGTREFFENAFSFKVY